MYMTIEDQLRAEGKQQGRVEGMANALLGVLRHRTLAVPQTLRERVLSTHDEQQIQRWFDRAFTVFIGRRAVRGL